MMDRRDVALLLVGLVLGVISLTAWYDRIGHGRTDRQEWSDKLNRMDLAVGLLETKLVTLQRQISGRTARESDGSEGAPLATSSTHARSLATLPEVGLKVRSAHALHCKA